MLYFLIIVWLGYWSAESGASLPWSSKWQNQVDWFSEIPEIITAFTISAIGIYGWYDIFNLSLFWVIPMWLVFFIIAYAGKQSATWGFLNWTGHKKDKNNDGIIDDRDGRNSTLRDWNNWVSSLFNWKLGDEGYSWVWAATKGFIITIPVGGITGLIFFPLGHELGSHADGRLFGDPNMWKELISGAALGLGCVVFLSVIKHF